MSDDRDRRIAELEAALFLAHKTLKEKIGKWLEAYPLDIFPDPPKSAPPKHYADPETPVDLYAARMGRHVAACFARDIEEAFAAPDLPRAAAWYAAAIEVAEALDATSDCHTSPAALEALARYREAERMTTQGEPNG